MKRCRKIFTAFATFVLVGATLAGCGAGNGANPQRLPTTKMSIGKEVFTLELATTDKEREIGLMNRKEMAEDHGMILIFNKPQVVSFWMKDTLIPLDLLYVDQAGLVTSIRRMKAQDLSPVGSVGDVKYVIELSANASDRAQINAGDKIPLPEWLVGVGAQ